MKPIKNFLSPKSKWHAPTGLTEDMTQEEVIEYFKNKGFIIEKDNTDTIHEICRLIWSLIDKYKHENKVLLYDVRSNAYGIRLFNPKEFYKTHLVYYMNFNPDKTRDYSIQELHKEEQFSSNVDYKFDEIIDIIKKDFNII